MPAHSPLSGHKTSETRGCKIFAILKHGIGIKDQKICKQVRDQRNGAVKDLLSLF